MRYLVNRRSCKVRKIFCFWCSPPILYLQTALLFVPLMSWERWFRKTPSALLYQFKMLWMSSSSWLILCRKSPCLTDQSLYSSFLAVVNLKSHLIWNRNWREGHQNRGCSYVQFLKNQCWMNFAQKYLWILMAAFDLNIWVASSTYMSGQGILSSALSVIENLSVRFSPKVWRPLVKMLNATFWG